MTPELQQIIRERLTLLPQTLQGKLLNAGGLRPGMLSLGKGYNLNTEQVALVENEVVLVLLAFTRCHELPENIARALGVVEDAVQPLVARILSEVLTPEVMKELDKIYAEQNKTSATPQTQQQQFSPVVPQPAPPPASPVPQSVQPPAPPPAPEPPPAPPAPPPVVGYSAYNAQRAPPARAAGAREPLVPPPSASLPPDTLPTPPNIPTYQRPLTQVPPAPPYRNANLYQKPPQ